MRETKFRAWNKITKQMSKPFTLVQLAIATDAYYQIEQVEFLQYTGLKDKNGKEIYEGDFVVYRDISGSGRVREFEKREIRWFKDSCSFNLSRAYNDAEMEVVGNIHEEVLNG